MFWLFRLSNINMHNIIVYYHGHNPRKCLATYVVMCVWDHELKWFTIIAIANEMLNIYGFLGVWEHELKL